MKGAIATYLAALGRDVTGVAVSNHGVKFGIDVSQGVDFAIGTKAYFKSIKEIGQNVSRAFNKFRTGNGLLSSLGGAFKDSVKMTPELSIAGKVLGKFAGGVGIAISGLDTFANIAQGDYASAAMSGGEALFSAATYAATGYGAPVAAGLVVAGGIAWGAGFTAKHWDQVTGWIRRRFN